MLLKRIFDFLSASMGLLLLSPFLLLISLGILLFDGPPIFFRQRRVGQYGGAFTLIKFRTMRPCQKAEHGAFDAGDDTRVTTFGRLLRKKKLDELPQLINVIRGDMSLVGPRPEVKKWVAVYPERWRKVLKVKPGITDPASILFRNEERILAAQPDPENYYRDIILPKKLDLYENYIRRAALGYDLKLIYQTLITVFSK